MNYLKTIPINLLTLSGAFIGTWIALLIDKRLGLGNYSSSYATIIGLSLVLYGLFFRFWASYIFYKNNLKVLELGAQQKFIIEGPYQYTRNPLYVGIVAISFGFVIYAGSISGFIGAALIPLLGWHLWITHIEESRLEQKFGDEYRSYKNRVPRWVSLKGLLLFVVALIVSISNYVVVSVHCFRFPDCEREIPITVYGTSWANLHR